MSFIQLTQPSGTFGAGGSVGIPLTVTVHPQVIFSILDHAIRHEQGQPKVIGTLLGIRSDDGTELEIKTAYGVPYVDSSEEGEFRMDMDYNQHMYTLHQKIQPSEVVIGWYSNFSEMNPLAFLAQGFYGERTRPFSPVYLSVDARPGQPFSVQAYVSSKIGAGSIRPVIAEDGSIQPTKTTVFEPVHTILKENSLVDAAGFAQVYEGAKSPSGAAQVISDPKRLQESIETVLEMVERVKRYVNDVIQGTAPARINVGKYLFAALATKPKVDPESVEQMITSHLQDVLMTVYLANAVKAQIDLSQKLVSTI
ncbi:hypothetical protein CANCADRAFT_32899 [Tortispora caseinolytica NRRL Y-17796]|uniref:MPN domain-containing protein n=1 Tax=Tortispora caseinolytica NRRL Y-17796 TaxID=767744 RepID=A0A1E4TD98_9ASCO|nr:hypothetical protein CANCADRAFT_32899 [Tortispora caseinolytica NRRL Y-17796]